MASNRRSIELLSGAIAGIVGRLTVTPLAVLRIRLQVQLQPKYTTLWPSLKLILAEEGIRGLFRGGLMGQLLYGTYSAVQFAVYHEIKVQGWKPSSLVAGSIAGAAASIASHPLDVLRTHFSVHGLDHYQVKYSSSIDAAREIYRRSGVFGFYRGLVPSLIEFVPLTAISFASYERVREFFPGKKDSAMVQAFSGCCAGIIAQLAMYPLDVIKKHIQLRDIPSDTRFANSVEKLRVRSTGKIRHVAMDLWKRDGPKAFWRGASVAVVKSSISTAVIFVVNEQLRAFLFSRQKNKK